MATNPDNIDYSFLEEFISCRGHEVFEDVKLSFKENLDIFKIITVF